MYIIITNYNINKIMLKVIFESYIQKMAYTRILLIWGIFYKLNIFIKYVNIWITHVFAYSFDYSSKRYSTPSKLVKIYDN